MGLCVSKDQTNAVFENGNVRANYQLTGAKPGDDVTTRVHNLDKKLIRDAAKKGIRVNLPQPNPNERMYIAHDGAVHTGIRSRFRG